MLFMLKVGSVYRVWWKTNIPVILSSCAQCKTDYAVNIQFGYSASQMPASHFQIDHEFSEIELMLVYGITFTIERILL